MSTALNRPADQLPHALTARDLFMEATTRAQAGVIFMGRDDTATQWWNWYMAADAPEWDAHFQVTTNTSTALAATNGWEVGQPVVQVSAPTKTGDATGTMPGPYDRRVVHFLMHVTRTLNDHGCALLRGDQHTV